MRSWFIAKLYFEGLILPDVKNCIWVWAKIKKERWGDGRPCGLEVEFEVNQKLYSRLPVVNAVYLERTKASTPTGTWTRDLGYQSARPNGLSYLNENLLRQHFLGLTWVGLVCVVCIWSRLRASSILKNNVKFNETESLVCAATEKSNLKGRMRSWNGKGAPTRSKPTSIQLKHVDYDLIEEMEVKRKEKKNGRGLSILPP